MDDHHPMMTRAEHGLGQTRAKMVVRKLAEIYFRSSSKIFGSIKVQYQVRTKYRPNVHVTDWSNYFGPKPTRSGQIYYSLEQSRLWTVQSLDSRLVYQP